MRLLWIDFHYVQDRKKVRTLGSWGNRNKLVAAEATAGMTGHRDRNDWEPRFTMKLAIRNQKATFFCFPPGLRFVFETRLFFAESNLFFVGRQVSSSAQKVTFLFAIRLPPVFSFAPSKIPPFFCPKRNVYSFGVCRNFSVAHLMANWWRRVTPAVRFPRARKD